ncbi:SDR family oxidoreductase [Paenibacillus methanolicus]|uniref:NAD(P)-dependent dehydrogenase (Short-subunit alcohol dehydrogenase family) n=1 Tax=Paenibacillus methanolicus TaxID=582686 RepID=A0A5S5BN53_9BACL|nr:SDR family oxidoreductase [Paenibacillus methanolicus]TYP68615.1 NAD(P)-dependent dehydrogenase (short-subunit alcohol dehydrogenase family) [Paenibacillus methanolicus]
MKNLQGKTALVTGASRGIGRAIAIRLAKEGALVAVHYGRGSDAAEEVVREITREGGTAFAVGAELGALDGVGRLYEQLDDALRAGTGDAKLDILVNNAGVGLVANIEDTTERQFDEVVGLNVKAPFFLVQQALPRLRNNGRIINLSSAVTRISLPVIPAYSMTKGAINALTLSLATQLAARGITINAIQPGFVATDMNASMLNDPDGRAAGANYSIFGRWGEPADIADIAAFLASPDSRWITGQCIDASGGTHL